VIRIGSRRWIAWKLVQLAHRIYDAEYHERITITDEHGRVGEFVIVADLYGCGVSSYSGPWKIGDCKIAWEEFTPEKEDES